MTAKELFYLGLVLPAILAVCWYQAIRLWGRREEAGENVAWLTGRASAAGFSAFLLPGVAGLSLMWIGSVISITQGRPSASVDDPSSWFLGVGFILLLGAFWMWAFAWPRWLVPPVTRGQRGWVAALWHQWRSGTASTE
jgi:hypothetical protein